MIAQYLIDNFDSTISSYFPTSGSSEKWKSKFTKQIEHINHDEPWLTLIASYALFGNQKETSTNRINAIKKVFKLSGLNIGIDFKTNLKVIVEERLPEILNYREAVREANEDGSFHLYPDRSEIIKDKIEKNSTKESFEGSTNLDLKIEGDSNGQPIVCYIEAKFLSDISYQTTYNPSRDQIIRNIDCGIDYVLDKNNPISSFNDFYFLLLTPKVFRTDQFGGSKKSKLKEFGASSSRLYCYKMNEYIDYKILKERLPHRRLTDGQWESIASNIGWMTFEDMYACSKEYNLIKSEKESGMIYDFFKERNLV